MAHRTATAVAMAAVLSTAAGAQVERPEHATLVVVLDVTNDAHILARDPARAQRWVSEVYGAIGVRVDWNDRHTSSTESDGAFHVDVHLISKDAPGGSNQPPGVEELGKAQRPVRRTYIFYG